MTTKDIAHKLVELCRQGRSAEALDTLYAPDAVSIEAADMPGAPSREIKGVAGIKAKGEWWIANHIIHDFTISGPFPHGDRFIVGFRFDVTSKPMGQRMQMEEAGLYHVKNGKIVREEFFYDM
jgi:ketosteroid isomerase-like protein